AKHEFHEDIADVQDLMQRSLKPTEILLVSPNDSGNHLFTILDIEKIDPTQPLDEQYESMEKLGDITLSQKAAEHALAEHYANRVILTFNNQPVIEQILDAIPDWHNFDGQLKIDIANILKTQIPKEYLSEKTNKQLQQEEQNLLQGRYDIKQVKDLAKEEANASGRGAKGKKLGKKKKQLNT
ncbi:MAG TPA: hypothetical protein VLG50_08770, partial [Candidatus Saccharimonadales bacterium]|nr:hypothetical protein [Candidatus Saccharimonadales bacterium]